MKVLVVGLGSIARKHIDALFFINPEIELFALRTNKTADAIQAVKNIYDFSQIPNDISFILISNPTSEHYKSVKDLSYLNKPFFIEKPSFQNLNQAEEISKLITKLNIKTYTAFNFRFHPAIVWLKENIHNFRVLEVQAYCGSYLPNWRPNIDYRNNYSAISKLGGGVHLDLIHELDFLIWIFGEPIKNHMFLNKVSDLELSSFDSALYFLEYETKTISVKLNYYRIDSKRSIEIVTDKSTLYVDLLNTEITGCSGEIIFKDNSPILDTYINQMRYFIKSINSDEKIMNNILESSKVLKYALQNN